VPIEVDQYCINYNGWQIGFSLCNWTDTLSNFNNTKKNHVRLKANFALRNEDQAACSSLSLYLHFLMSGFNYVEKSFFVTDHCLTFTNASSPPHHRPLSSVCCLMEEMAHIRTLSTFPPLVWNAFESRWKRRQMDCR